MLIGVLSDSHGRVQVTRRAIDLLIDAGAELLLHLGDLETDAILDELAGHPARVVFGNCDWDPRGLRRYAESLDLVVDHPSGRIDVDGRTIAYTHGDNARLMHQALADGVDYLLHGHSHTLRDERVGSTRILNPGALFRASRYTAGLLEPGADRWRIVEVPRDE